MSETFYTFIFPIGDYHCEGHSRYTNYMVKSNKTLEELQLIHNSCEAIYGFNISSICNEENVTYLSGDMLNKLIDLGIITDHADTEDTYELYSSVLLQIWLKLLKLLDHTLILEDVSSEYKSITSVTDIRPTLKVPGYGLYD